MSEKKDYGFCPRCGALMQDGVCKSCGFGGKMGPGVQVTMNQSFSPGQPVHKKKNKLVIGLVIGGIALLMLLFVASVVFFMYTVSKEASRSGAYQDGFGDNYGGDYDYNYDYDDGFYEPDPKDPYYEELADAISEDFSYHVIWYTDSIDPDYSESPEKFYSIYPMLEGENQEVLDEINARIQNEALKYKAQYKDYKGGCRSYGYVTYMDEEKCSIVIQHYLGRYEEMMDAAEIRLEAMNFHVSTGEGISYTEILELDNTTAARFREQDRSQNGGVEYVQKLSDEELLERLQNQEEAILFYTPVGLEAGFNYEEGWVTVTFKENAI